MPYPNFHAARIRNPKNFAWIKVLEKLPNGIMIYGGILKSDPEGKSKTQAYRFQKDKFSFAQAKDWLEKHKIKYISFEEAKEMQAFNVQLQCFILSDISQEEILRHIEPDILNKIKQKDLHPFFTAYSIAHEGESNPRILNDPSNKPIIWLKEAIQSIKNKIKKGIKFFKGHNDDNSTDNREALGEVVGDFQKEINGNLNHIVIGYHPKDKVQEVKKRTICSQEAIWNLADQGVNYIAGALKELTGIALGRPEEEQPAFRGAQRLGMVQAFEINNPGRIKETNMAVTYEDLLTVDVRLLQRVIEARAFWPNQLFGNDYDMSQDRIFGQIYREKEKLQTENEQLKTE